MRKKLFSVKLDGDIVHRLVADSLQRRVSRGHLVREAIRSHYGIELPGQALAEALANADAPWVNGHEG